MLNNHLPPELWQNQTLLTTCSAAAQLSDFKYLYDLKNVYFVLVMSTETERSMRPLVSPSLSKKKNILEKCTEETSEPQEWRTDTV